MTAYQYIIEHAPFAVSDKSLSRIMHLETKTTSLGICDNILAAIDDTGAIEDGRISLIPNPTWSKSKWKNWSREEFREAAEEMQGLWG
jgi:hypothetical protein